MIIHIVNCDLIDWQIYGCFFYSQSIVKVLRKQILDLTTNLREGEELKKSLKSDRDRYRESRNKYRLEVDMERKEVAAMKTQEHTLKTQVLY